jgi:group I intron endonuclease
MPTITMDDETRKKILDDITQVRTDIYCIEHTESGKKYVGQARTHRENHGRYRPFGAEARFRHHVSEAISNTKHKTGHLLGVDIRAYGKDAFTVRVLETCDLDKANERETYWIAALNTVYPAGYNISLGGIGNNKPIGMAPIPNPTPLAAPRPRGGCTSRSDKTREIMSERSKESSRTLEGRAARSSQAKSQHSAAKANRFAGATIDPTKLDEYIILRKNCVLVRVGDHEARFTSKTETPEAMIVRAKEFLQSLLTTSTASVTPAGGAGATEE